MTIRLRFILGFAAILTLFTLNWAIFVYTSNLRSEAVQTLSRTQQRRLQLAELVRGMERQQKAAALQTSITESADPTSPGGVPAGGADISKDVVTEIAKLRELVIELRETSDPTDKEMESLTDGVNKSADGWTNFYKYSSTKQSFAAMDNQIKADQAASQVLVQIIPALQKRAEDRAQSAQEEMRRVEHFSNNTTVGILLLSVVVLLIGHFMMSTKITSALRMLTEGVTVIGHGHFEHKIPLESKDELGTLATAFNEMSNNLQVAQNDVTQAMAELGKRNEEVEKQKLLSDALLRNILPAQVAEELHAKGMVEPKYFEDVTILFTDFVGFTLSTEKMAAEELVKLLHEYFTVFDRITARYGLEKMKTIGDAYMCVGGLPARNPSHPVDSVMAALEMCHYVSESKKEEGAANWEVRIGLHTGSVVAGVVGIQKFAFDVWGENVNFASRMESSGQPNRINVSTATYARIKDFFECEHRGKILTKEKKEADMYFVSGLHPNLVDDSGLVPPPAFERRYRTYFQREPSAFPAFLVEEAARLRKTAV